MIPQGYKHTEIGIIPNEWDVIDFGDIVSYTKGFAFKSRDYKSDGIRIIRVSDTTFNSIKEENAIYIDESRKKEFENWRLEEYDLIFTTVGSKPPLYDSMVGKVIMIDKFNANTFLNQNAVLIRNKKRKKFLQVFLLNQFRTKRYLQHIEEIYRGNANQASITLDELFKFKIALPKEETEQQAIAQALSDADELISSLEKLIAKKRLIKQGAMQELLTPKQGWEVKKLGEVSKIIMGQSPLSSYYNTECNGLPLVQGNADISNRKVIIRNYTSVTTKKAKANSIIMSVRAPVGEISETEFECCIGRGVCSIEYNNRFLYHYLVFIENTWSKHSTGSTFDSINSNQVKELEIIIPKSLTEQTHIAAILSDMDEEIENLEQKLDKYKSIKQGMMQDLLTGKVRLM